MPKGLPSAEALMARSVTFFSIDTDVIQALGYKFSEGALHALALQRPSWVEIRLTEIVEREVMAHRTEPVGKAITELLSALANTQRLTSTDLHAIKEQVDAMHLADKTRDRFAGEFAHFLERLGGVVLPLDGEKLAKMMFDRYFEQRPPFEQRKDKKHEFPDAAALLVLEEHAKSKKTQGVLISQDEGWSKFAQESEHLYCVKSLEEFAALFESTGKNAEEVIDKIVNALNDSASDLYQQLDSEIRFHADHSDWEVGEIYTGYTHRVEGAVIGTRYVDGTIDFDSISIWFVEHDPSMCTVELTVTITFDLDIEADFFQYDTIDHDEFSAGSAVASRQVEVELELFIECRGDLLASQVDDWDIDFNVPKGEYLVDVGEVEPDYSSDYDD